MIMGGRCVEWIGKSVALKRVTPGQEVVAGSGMT